MNEIKFKTIEEYLNTTRLRDIKNILKQEHIAQIHRVIEYFDKHYLVVHKNPILDFIKYDVDGDWVERMIIIRDVLKKDAISPYACEIRYGKKQGENIAKERARLSAHTIETFINKYGQELGQQKYNEYLKTKTSIGIDVMVERYGEIEGKKKWDMYYEKWIKGVEKRKDNGWKSGQTLEEFQEKHGVDEGLKKWNQKREKRAYKSSLEYYIEKYGDSVGRQKWNEYCISMDKTSLHAFIDRYGEEEGISRYDKFCKKMSYFASLEYYKIKYGEEKGEIKFTENRIKMSESLLKIKNKKYSKISQDLFWNIYDMLSILQKDLCKFAELNSEECFYFFNDTKSIQVDFKMGNKIIEFYGDYWHANPSMFNKDEVLNFKKGNKNVSDIWESDNSRLKLLEEKKYEILIVWQNDYIQRKKGVINKCLNFLNS